MSGNPHASDWVRRRRLTWLTPDTEHGPEAGANANGLYANPEEYNISETPQIHRKEDSQESVRQIRSNAREGLMMQGICSDTIAFRLSFGAEGASYKAIRDMPRGL